MAAALPPFTADDETAVATLVEHGWLYATPPRGINPS
jgi:hypothetical protein